MKAKAKVFAVVALNPRTGELSVIAASTSATAASTFAGIGGPRGWQTAPVFGEIELPVTEAEGAEPHQFAEPMLPHGNPLSLAEFVNDSDEVLRLNEDSDLDVGSILSMLGGDRHSIN